MLEENILVCEVQSVFSNTLNSVVHSENNRWLKAWNKGGIYFCNIKILCSLKATGYFIQLLWSAEMHA